MTVDILTRFPNVFTRKGSRWIRNVGIECSREHFGVLRALWAILSVWISDVFEQTFCAFGTIEPSTNINSLQSQTSAFLYYYPRTPELRPGLGSAG